MALDIPFQFVSNDPALDLVNTKITVDGAPLDLIATDEAVTAWLAAALPGISQGDWTPSEAEALRRLRDGMSVAVEAVQSGTRVPAGALALLNDHLAEHVPTSALQEGPEGLRLIQSPVTGPAAILALLADHGARLLTEVARDRLKTCAHPDCVLVFRDTSKSGRRRWCSMKTCGNRSKVAAFRTGR